MTTPRPPKNLKRLKKIQVWKQLEAQMYIVHHHSQPTLRIEAVLQVALNRLAHKTGSPVADVFKRLCKAVDSPDNYAREATVQQESKRDGTE
jgi:hypothetical protein